MSECTTYALRELDLFTGQEVIPGQYKLPRKYKKRKSAKERRREARRKKGIQYSIKLKVRANERKIAFRNRLHEESGNDLEVFNWDPQSYGRFLINMLDYIPHEIAELVAVKSNRIAEIVVWVKRRWSDDPFSFEECCRAIGVDPNEKREQLLETIAELYDGRTDHYEVLRRNFIDAEAGDLSAVRWILSEQDTGMSFNVCCRALGFSPKKARAEAIIPHDVLELIENERVEDEVIDEPVIPVFNPDQLGMFQDPRQIDDPVVQEEVFFEFSWSI